jgi:protein-S-isoprenylcysteine O-methyltransferase Ste14
MRAITHDIGMPALALAFLLVYGLLSIGVRMVFHIRRTGSTGFKGLRGGSRSELAGGLLLVSAVVMCIAGPALQLAGLIDQLGALTGALARILGIALAAAGIAMTVLAQFAMGDAWRVGVDPSERTALVTDGPFSLARNPIFAAMIPAFTGILLLAPNLLTIAGAILLTVALELHVRRVEEPYLLWVHGEQYAAYAAGVGRFIPGIGRLRNRLGLDARQALSVVPVRNDSSDDEPEHKPNTDHHQSARQTRVTRRIEVEDRPDAVDHLTQRLEACRESQDAGQRLQRDGAPRGREPEVYEDQDRGQLPERPERGEQHERSHRDDNGCKRREDP